MKILAAQEVLPEGSALGPLRGQDRKGPRREDLGRIDRPITPVNIRHQLIRQGAKLVETTDDIVSELAPLAGHVLQNAVESTAKRTSSTSNDDEYQALSGFLSHDPIHVDELVRQSGLTIDEVSSMLLILELEGKVEKLAGGHYSVLS